MKFLTQTAAAILLAGTAATSVFAEGHSSKRQLIVPQGLCPQMIQQLASWAVDDTTWTVYAAPSRGWGEPRRECGEPGPAVTVGIANGPHRGDAAVAALRTCNANRGSHGWCVLIGAVRIAP